MRLRLTVDPHQQKKIQVLRGYLRILKKNEKLTNKETLDYLLSLMPKEAEEFIQEIEKIERGILKRRVVLMEKGGFKNYFKTVLVNNLIRNSTFFY